MSFAHPGVGRGCLIWSKEPWPDRSHLSSVSVSIPSSHSCTSFPCFVYYFAVVGVIVSLCFQVKEGMGRCGGELGWVNGWLSRSFPPETSSPGSERRRFIILYSCDMTTYWVWQTVLEALSTKAGTEITIFFLFDM